METTYGVVTRLPDCSMGDTMFYLMAGPACANRVIHDSKTMIFDFAHRKTDARYRSNWFMIRRDMQHKAQCRLHFLFGCNSVHLLRLRWKHRGCANICKIRSGIELESSICFEPKSSGIVGQLSSMSSITSIIWKNMNRRLKRMQSCCDFPTCGNSFSVLTRDDRNAILL